jgi:hypothetical protein
MHGGDATGYNKLSLISTEVPLQRLRRDQHRTSPMTAPIDASTSTFQTGLGYFRFVAQLQIFDIRTCTTSAPSPLSLWTFDSDSQLRKAVQ